VLLLLLLMVLLLLVILCCYFLSLFLPLLFFMRCFVAIIVDAIAIVSHVYAVDVAIVIFVSFVMVL